MEQPLGKGDPEPMSVNGSEDLPSDTVSIKRNVSPQPSTSQIQSSGSPSGTFKKEPSCKRKTKEFKIDEEKKYVPMNPQEEKMSKFAKPKFPQETALELRSPKAQTTLKRIGLSPQGRMVIIRDKCANNPIRDPRDIPSTSKGITASAVLSDPRSLLGNEYCRQQRYNREYLKVSYDSKPSGSLKRTVIADYAIPSTSKGITSSAFSIDPRFLQGNIGGPQQGYKREYMKVSYDRKRESLNDLKAIPSTSKGIPDSSFSFPPIVKDRSESSPATCERNDGVRKKVIISKLQKGGKGKKSKEEDKTKGSITDDKIIDLMIMSREFEKRASGKALKKCEDPAVKNLLSFDNLVSAFKRIGSEESGARSKIVARRSNVNSESDEAKCLPTARLKSDDHIKIGRLLQFPHHILEMCWMDSCINTISLKGCSQCYLTYCNLHISKTTHGCTTECFDKVSLLKKPGAHFVSARVKMLGKKIENKTVQAVLCHCGKCSLCKFCRLYIKIFAPHAPAVSQKECFLNCH